MPTTILYILLAYFVAAALINGYINANDREGWEKHLAAVTYALLTPPIALGLLAWDGWLWVRDYGQLNTFWYYLTRSPKLKRTPEELELVHRITLQHRNTGSLQDRLWRLAERCTFRYNNYTPTEE